jgi:hypothetical protein
MRGPKSGNHCRPNTGNVGIRAESKKVKTTEMLLARWQEIIPQNVSAENVGGQCGSQGRGVTISKGAADTVLTASHLPNVDPQHVHDLNPRNQLFVPDPKQLASDKQDILEQSHSRGGKKEDIEVMHERNPPPPLPPCSSPSGQTEVEVEADSPSSVKKQKSKQRKGAARKNVAHRSSAGILFSLFDSPENSSENFLNS